MSVTISFETWQATRKKVKVKGSVFEDWDVNCDEVWAYLYDGKSCMGYIEIRDYYYYDEYDRSMNKFQANYLILERDEHISWNLADLEKRLYQWYVDEGMFDDTVTQMQRSIECDIHNFQNEGWRYMAQKYNPESGDFCPSSQHMLDEALKTAITEWINQNVDIKKRWK